MRITLITLSCVAALLVTGYAMHAAKDSQFRRQHGIPARASVRDIGEVALSDGIPLSFQLGNGKDLIVTATAVTDQAKLATVPAAFTNGVLQLNLSYTSKSTSGGTTESYSERQTLMYPQRGLLALTLAQESSHPIAVLMKPRLIAQ
jgi:hypothetical protein